MKNKPKLSPVDPVPTGDEPPPELGERGRRLWSDVLAQYRELTDIGGRETLRQLCTAADRAERLRLLIQEQGEAFSVNGTWKANPLLKEELACRAFITRSLARLGLEIEPTRPTPGRPGGGLG